LVLANFAASARNWNKAALFDIELESLFSIESPPYHGPFSVTKIRVLNTN